MHDEWLSLCLVRPFPLDRREELASALATAFPLPSSGCFDDLLQALDEPKDERR